MPESDPAAGLVLRPATEQDLPAVAILYVLARAAAVPDMPPSIHPPADQRAWVHTWDLSTHELWVAEDAADTVVGFARFTTTWLDDLYVHPGHRRGGVGSLLLSTVQALRPDGFGLWVFTTNTPARAFYARHGFTDVAFTDGTDNEERAPEVEMKWPGRSSA